ncbi:hypothetical protein [Kaistia sp. UC242_56]|uniref:hypothetical protein n=1 Tax=Kaistia sp. UC242_56 TaxID=3374625 RepID=UPI0037895255
MKDHNKNAWTAAMIDRLRELSQTGDTTAVMAETMNREFGLSLSRYSLIGKMRREGIASGNPRKLHTPGQSKKRAKVAAPSIVTDDVPFLPPVKLVVEYVPPGLAPETFLAVGPFKCRQFLPGQDHKSAPEQLVCANPIEPGARRWFCAACSERFSQTGSAAPTEDDGEKFNALRKRSALTGALL